MTQSLEEYLKTIYYIVKQNSYARVTDIATSLEYSKPSVNRALNVLKNEEFIHYEPYGNVTLTKKGEEVAKDIVRKHNTLKAFLVTVLNVEEEVAKEESKAMKHAISEDTVNKLEKYIESIIDVDSLNCNYNKEDEKCIKCINLKTKTKFDRIKKEES